MQTVLVHDIFISYSIKDKAAAEAVCAALERADLRCWIAPRDVMPGMNWGSAILAAINSSRAMVLVFSSHANQSPHVLREVERAVHHSLPIIPLRLENVPPTDALEFFISVPHWLDAITPPLEAHLDKLVQTLQRLLNTPARPPAVVATPPPPPVAPVRSRARSRWILAAAFGVMVIFLGAIVLTTLLLVRRHHQVVQENPPQSTPAPATRPASTKPAGQKPRLDLSPLPNFPINWPNLAPPESPQEPVLSWRELRSQAGHFHVLMPGKPQLEHSALNTEVGQVDMYYWGIQQDPYSFAIMYADYPPSALKDRDPQQMLTNARDGAIANVGGALVSDQNIQLSDHPGREVHISIQNEKMMGIARFFLVRNRLFILICVTDREHILAPAIDKFMNSFTLDE